MHSMISQVKPQRAILALTLFLMVSVFFVRGMVFLDPDFGWHLRMGQIISSSGIPATDPFSYTMPSFPFIDHEWLTNVIISKLYPPLGKIGMAAIYSLIALSALAIAVVNPLSRKVSLKRLDLGRRVAVPSFLGAAIFLLYSGIRPQVESWFLLAVLLWIVLNQTIWRRWRFLLPALYILWANLHGSFAVGLVTLFMVLILRTIRVRRIDFGDLIVAALSLLATFINPYGVRIWYEVWLQISDTSLRWTIAEWMPALFTFNVPLVVLTPLSVFLLWKYRGRFYLEEKGLFLFFLVQGLASTRHIPLWVVVVTPLLSLGIDFLYRDIKKIPFGIARFNKSYKVALLGCLGIFVLESLLSLNSARLLAEEAFYPSKAVQYLREDLPVGNVFSSYNWGGYLIWKLPEKKVFIDGRMPSWRWKANIASESNYAMKDYGALLAGKLSSKDVFAKYGIDTVLWPVPVEFDIFGYLDDKLDKLLNRFGKKRHDFNLYEELEKNGWEKVYEDRVSVIYQKHQ